MKKSFNGIKRGRRELAREIYIILGNDVFSGEERLCKIKIILENELK
jgi:hypothetical protein